MTQFQQIVISLVREGRTVSEIAKILKRNMSSVSSVVKAFNLTPKRKYVNTVEHTFFDKINTAAKAYLLGFFIADGCINKSTSKSRSRFSINQSEDDKEIIKAFKKYLQVPSEVQIINNQSGVKHRKLQWRLRWTSVHMEETLKTVYNILPGKTDDGDFKFPIELIPEKYQGAFVLGFIDGDGYMGNNGNENNFSISIVGTSEKFITMIGDLVSEATGMIYNVYHYKGKTIDYLSLRWSCEGVNKLEKITKLRNYLYKNTPIFLSRKREKMDTYIKYRANALDNTNAQCNA